MERRLRSPEESLILKPDVGTPTLPPRAPPAWTRTECAPRGEACQEPGTEPDLVGSATPNAAHLGRGRAQQRERLAGRAVDALGQGGGVGAGLQAVVRVPRRVAALGRRLEPGLPNRQARLPPRCILYRRQRGVTRIDNSPISLPDRQARLPPCRLLYERCLGLFM